MDDNQLDNNTPADTSADNALPPEASSPDKPNNPTKPAESVKEPWANSKKASHTGASAFNQPDKKKRIKAKVDAIISKSPRSTKVKVNGKTYSISNIHTQADMLCCTVEGPGLTDNDFRFVNPPIKVPDGTTSTRMGVDGVEYELAHFKEDPKAALLQMVKDAVTTVLSNNN